MAEYINRKDDLNTGREKLNASIKDSEEAKVTSISADNKATQALDQSQSTQTQLDTIVLNGDSSVEAAQARVDEKGVAHTTLKERIDDGFVDTNSKLDIESNKSNLFRGDYIPLNTPDGYNQSTHPSVLYLESGFGGYKYWMAFTPYPFTNDFYENPCIKASIDGVDWIDPTEGLNPLDSVTETESQNGEHFSDTELVFNKDTNTLEVWYRWTNKNTGLNRFYRRTSIDGVNWSTRELVWESSYLAVSPALEIKSDGTYQMWFVRNSPYRIEYFETKTPNQITTWESKGTVNLNYKMDDSVDPWHIGIYKETDNIYHVVFSENSQSHAMGRSIYYGLGNNPLEFNEVRRILRTSTNMATYGSYYLYRPSLIKVEDTFKMYIGGRYSNQWQIGLYEGLEIDSLIPSDLITSLGLKLLAKIKSQRSEAIEGFFQRIFAEKEIRIRIPGVSEIIFEMVDGKLVIKRSSSALATVNFDKLQVSEIYKSEDDDRPVLYMSPVEIRHKHGFKLIDPGRTAVNVQLSENLANIIEFLSDSRTSRASIAINGLLLDGDAAVLDGMLRYHKDTGKAQLFSTKGNTWWNLNNYQRTVPTSATSPGTSGDYAVDSNYLYVCYQAARWIRISKDNTW